jgi:hypothetical protein
MKSQRVNGQLQDGSLTAPRPPGAVSDPSWSEPQLRCGADEGVVHRRYRELAKLNCEKAGGSLRRGAPKEKRLPEKSG